MIKIQVALLKVSIPRPGSNFKKTKKIIGYKEVDEDRYYRPIVEMILKDIEKDKELKGGLNHDKANNHKQV
jgi:hypothetical protein